MIAPVTWSISGMPGPPAGPSYRITTTSPGWICFALTAANASCSVSKTRAGPRCSVRSTVSLTTQPSGAIIGEGLGDSVALITDGRFSGATHGFMVGHIVPEAFRGGPIAALQEGDVICIDVAAGELRVELSDDEIAARLAGWSPPPPRYESGVLAKYAALVSSASEGAVTRP